MTRELDIIDKKILRTDKENGQFEFVSMKYAVDKLRGTYVGDIEKLLNDGCQLQTLFSFYEKVKFPNQKHNKTTNHGTNVNNSHRNKSVLDTKR